MRKFGYLVLIVVLGLTACSRNRIQAPELSSGKPSHASLYYFMAGFINQEWGNYAVAEEAFDKALTYDYRSYQIRKHKLLNAIYRFQTNEIDAPRFQACLENSGIVPDEQILLSLFNLYQSKNDSLALDSTLSRLEQSYPSSRIHFLRFIYDYNYHSRVNFDALERSASSNPEPDFLVMLVRLYTEMNPPAAYNLIHNYNLSSPDAESIALEESILLNWLEPSYSISYFAGLEGEDGVERKRSFLEQAFYLGKGELVLALGEQIILSGDYEMMETLALAALLYDEEELLDILEQVVNAEPTDSEARNQIFVLLLCRDLIRDNPHGSAQYSQKLFSVAQIESILSIYLIEKNPGFQSVAELAPQALEAFFLAWERVVDDPAALGYLRSYAAFLREAINQEEFINSKRIMARTLIERGFGSVDDFYLVVSGMNLHKEQEPYLDMLRRAYVVHPEDSGIQNSLGYVLVCAGELEEGAALIRLALEQKPEDPSYLDSYAWYQYLKGDYEAAWQSMQIPLLMEDMPSEVAYHIAQILRALQRYDEALSFFEKAIEAGDDPHYVDLSGQALQELRPVSQE